MTTIEPEALEEEIKRFAPHLVISSPPMPANTLTDSVGYIELSSHSDQPSKIRLGERYWESANLTLEELLSVIDEIEDTRSGSP